MICVNVKPASNFSNSTRVSSYIPNKDNPKGESVLDFAFSFKDFHETGGEILAKSFMSVSPTGTSRQSFNPSILTLDFNKYLFPRFKIFYRIIRCESMRIASSGIIYFLSFFSCKRPVFVDMQKLFGFVGYFELGVVKQKFKNIEKILLCLKGKGTGQGLPVCTEPQFIASHNINHNTYQIGGV